MKLVHYVIIIVFLLTAQFALSSEDVGSIPEKVVKNFTYRLAYSDRVVTLKDGKYESTLRPGNEEDLKNYINVRIEDYLVMEDCTLKGGVGIPVAFVVLSENFGGSEDFSEITALVKNGDKITQVNSIKLNDEIKKIKIGTNRLSFELAASPFEFSECEVLLMVLTNKEDGTSSSNLTLLKLFKFGLVIDISNVLKLVSRDAGNRDYLPPIVKKPALYLYPEETQEVVVKLNPKGVITGALPEYKGEWLVTVSPNGVIDNKYQYLFYEVELSVPISLPKEGWLVRRESLGEWFDNILPKLGLNEREIRDFKEYWLGELVGYPYYKIRLLEQDFIRDNLGIKMIPKPTTLIRLIFHFEGTHVIEKMREPLIRTPVRKGFTVVEWGGILGSSKKVDSKTTNLPLSYSFSPTQKGIVILKSLEIGGNKIRIKVDTGGCTDKSSIKAIVKKSEMPNPYYEITFVREKEDFCKAFLSEGVVIEYDIDKDFNIKDPSFIRVNNPVEAYGNVKHVPTEKKKEEPPSYNIANLKKEVKYATIYSIKQEIERYESGGETVKVKKLMNELGAIMDIKDEEFTIPEKVSADGTKVPSDESSFGPIVPCKVVNVEIVVDKKISIGDILNVKGMTKSGPFYHLAGARGDVLYNLQEGKRYEATILLVYKKEYFGFIPNYYVYLADVKEK